MPERICNVCSKKARWVVEAEEKQTIFICNRHLSSTLNTLDKKQGTTAFFVRTIEDYYVHFCLDCGRSVRKLKEFYMVWDTVWLSVCSNRRGMLCVGCMEKRLGRKLVPGDFTHCPLNTRRHNISKRLYNRLGHHIRHGKR